VRIAWIFNCIYITFFHWTCSFSSVAHSFLLMFAEWIYNLNPWIPNLTKTTGWWYSWRNT
jgi:hypothetical protein